MKFLRLLLSFAFCLIICYAPELTDHIYSHIDKEQFKKIGNLNDFEASCTTLGDSAATDCRVLYAIPITKLADPKTSSEIIEVGAGVISGGTEWYCSTDGKPLKIFENSPQQKTYFREGLMLYSTATVPTYLCKNTLYIKVVHDTRSFVTKTGWKSGSLVSGQPTVIRSYKNITDFFSSYFRILLATLCLILLAVTKTPSSEKIRGYSQYREAILFLSLHFFASSSILDVLLPNSFGLGFLILMAGGTTGCICLLLSATGSAKLFSSKEDPLQKSPRYRPYKINSTFLFLAFVAYYFFATGKNYLVLQGSIALTLFALSLVAMSPSYLLFSSLFISNVLAALGILPGFPTNTATHFILILFIFDSFENIHINNSLGLLLSAEKEKLPATALSAPIVRRFSPKRLSTSMFTKDYEFITRRLSLDGESVLNVERKVSRLAAHVMTARRPLIRIRVGSDESKILKGPGTNENKSKGREFCIFPLVHSDRILGTLNISGYNPWSLGDPSQMFLFYSMLQKILPRLAETRYREGLSPNIEDQHQLREIETNFLSLVEKSKAEFLQSMNAIAKCIDAKMIISKASPADDKFETFSSHHYGENEARFLENHTPPLKSNLLTSPANIAYHHKTTVFISNLESMFSIYPEFLVKLLRTNDTKSLYVRPIHTFDGKDLPWGVVWLEFSNRINRPESDLRELADFVTVCIERMLSSFFESSSQQNIVNEISTAVPKHILEKIKKDIDPREQEEGYLLNIDLAGSTNLSKKLGSKRFSEEISKINDSLTLELTKYGFVSQIIVWDSFALTRKNDGGFLIDEKLAEEILLTIDSQIAAFNQTLDDDCQISFRAVLNYGDTSRDWSKGSAKYWTIVGSAYAESCKLESELKPQKRVLLLAATCPNIKQQQIIKLSSKRTAA